MRNGYTKAELLLAGQMIPLLGYFIVQFAVIGYITLETVSGGWVALISVTAKIPLTTREVEHFPPEWVVSVSASFSFSVKIESNVKFCRTIHHLRLCK